MPRSPKATAWCFTLNNPVAAETPCFQENWMRYLVYQLEEGDAGTPHFQGYVQCLAQVRLTKFKAWLPRAHFEPAKGSPDQNYKYCTKEPRLDGPTECGNMTSQGKRKDIDRVRDFLLETKRTRREIIMECPTAFDKFPRLMDAIFEEHNTPAPMVNVQLRDWQKEALTTILQQNDRNILWIVDTLGNTGKSFLTKYLVSNHGAILVAGTDRDIASAYNGERVIVVDIPRDLGSEVPYATLEQLKNGLLFSSKYHSTMKRFEPPAVVVMSNFHADGGKWSADRLVEMDVTIGPLM